MCELWLMGKTKKLLVKLTKYIKKPFRMPQVAQLGFYSKDKYQANNIMRTLFQFSSLRPNFKNLGPECSTVLKNPGEKTEVVFEILNAGGMLRSLH